jgi:hypothetical protein
MSHELSTSATPDKVNRQVASLADLHTTIDDAPALIGLLLSPEGRAGHWHAGALVSPLEQITPAAISDLLTLDLANRPDVDLHFGKEDLTGTLAAAFDHPNATWVEVLDSFFSLWERAAFPAHVAGRPEDLAPSETAALRALHAHQARLLSQRAAV